MGDVSKDPTDHFPLRHDKEFSSQSLGVKWTPGDSRQSRGHYPSRAALSPGHQNEVLSGPDFRFKSRKHVL